MCRGRKMDRVQQESLEVAVCVGFSLVTLSSSKVTTAGNPTKVRLKLTLRGSMTSLETYSLDSH